MGAPDDDSEHRDCPRGQLRCDYEQHCYGNDQLGERNRRRQYYADVWFVRAVTAAMAGLFLAGVHRTGLPTFDRGLSLAALGCFAGAAALAGTVSLYDRLRTDDLDATATTE